jgi:hypothetical protein
MIVKIDDETLYHCFFISDEYGVLADIPDDKVKKYKRIWKEFCKMEEELQSLWWERKEVKNE